MTRLAKGSAKYHRTWNDAVAGCVIPTEAAAVHPQWFEDLALQEFFQPFTADHLYYFLKQRVAFA